MKSIALNDETVRANERPTPKQVAHEAIAHIHTISGKDALAGLLVASGGTGRTADRLVLLFGFLFADDTLDKRSDRPSATTTDKTGLRRCLGDRIAGN